jgi:hypothetical protein
VTVTLEKPRTNEKAYVAPVRISHGEAAAAAAPARRTPLAALLTGHVLQDGELVLLILRPSLWYILLSSLRFTAVIAILLIAAKLRDEQLPGQNIVYVEAGMFVLAGRVMFAVLQWMSRLYILTDLRVIRLSGVFNVELFDCPLRKIARTRLIYTVRERVLGLGSIEIIPQDENLPISVWQTIARPLVIHDKLVATINRAKQGGPMCHV